MIQYSLSKADFENVVAIPNGEYLDVYFDPKNLEEADGCIYKSTHRKVSVHGYGYADIVAAVIGDKYTADEIAAIQNNYIRTLLEPEFPNKAKYESEMIALQSWRDKAKLVAKTAIEYLALGFDK